MTDASFEEPEPTLHVFRLIRDAVALLRYHWRSLWVFLLLPPLLQLALEAWLVGPAGINPMLRFTAPEMAPQPPMNPAEMTAWEPITVSSVTLVINILTFLGGLMAMRTAFDIWTTGRADGARSVSTALRRCIPVLLVGIVAALAVGLGYIALIVPGLYLMGRFFVVQPVTLIKGGWLGNLGATFRLTRGYGWPLLGLLALVLGVSIAAVMTAGALLYGLAFFDKSIGALLVAGTVSVIVSGFIYGLSMITAMAAYLRLNEMKGRMPETV